MADIFSAPDRQSRRPEISYANSAFEKMGDSPSVHRWRAWWHNDYVTNRPAGIHLTCYPVMRETPSGVWIDPFAFWDDWSAPGYVGWRTFDKQHWRWVANGSRSS